MEFHYAVQAILDLNSSELSTSASQLAWTTGIRPHAQLQSNFQCFSKCENELNKDECAVEISFYVMLKKSFCLLG
jgi:hypothetical protein